MKLLPLILCILLSVIYDFVFEYYPEYASITFGLSCTIYFVTMIIDIILMKRKNIKIKL